MAGTQAGGEAGGHRSTRRASTPTLVLGGVLAVGIAARAIAPASWANPVYDVPALIFTAAMLAGILRRQPELRACWLLLWAGVVCWLSGDLIWTWLEDIRGVEVPFPSLADAGYLAFYPLAFLGVLGLMDRISPAEERWETLLDALMLVTAVALPLAALVLEPLADQDLDRGELAITAAYPLADLLLLGVLARMALLREAVPPALAYVAVAISSTFAGDVLFAVEFGDGAVGGVGGVVTDVLWLASFGLLAIAAWQPMRPVRPPRLPRPLEVISVRLAYLVLIAVMVTVFTLGQLAAGRLEVGATTMLLTFALWLLLIVRLLLLNRTLQRQTLGLARSEHQREQLVAELVRAAEEDRTSLAGELHDRPIQTLIAVSLQVDRTIAAVERDQPVDTRELLDGVRRDLVAAIADLRSLMSELRPPVLDEGDVGDALRDRLAQLQARTDARIHLSVGDLPPLDRQLTGVVYRVVQEAVVNAIKHAGATRIDASVDHDDEVLYLKVEDDGRGFEVADLDEQVRSGHIGLAAMTERVALAEGELEIATTPGEGTCITAAFPCRPP